MGYVNKQVVFSGDNTIQYDNAYNATIDDFKINFKPLQDLHGFAGSYPNGYSRNLVPPTTDSSWTSGYLDTDGVTVLPADLERQEMISDFIPVEFEDYNPQQPSKKRYNIRVVVSGIPLRDFKMGVYFYKADHTFSGLYDIKQGENYWLGATDSIYKYMRFWFTTYGKDNTVMFAEAYNDAQSEHWAGANYYAPYKNYCPINGWDGIRLNIGDGISDTSSTLLTFQSAKGKNLFNSNRWKEAESYPFQKNTYFYCSDIVQLEPDTDYAISAKVNHLALSKGGGLYIKNYSDGQDINNLNHGSEFLFSNCFKTTDYMTIHTGSGYIRFCVKNNSNYSKQEVLDDMFDLSDLQIEKGRVSTAFEPFNNTIYGGYIDLLNKEIVEKYCAYTITSTNNIFTYRQSYNRWEANLDNIAPAYITDPCAQVFSDVFVIADQTKHRPFSFLRDRALSTLYLLVDKTDIFGTDVYLGGEGVPEDNTAFLTWLDEYKPTIVFQLKNPVHYPLSINDISLIKGNNVIFSNTNDIIEMTLTEHYKTIPNLFMIRQMVLANQEV